MIVNKKDKKKKKTRYTVFYIIMSIMFIAIVTKLIYLQVYKHEDYKEKADIGSTRLIAEKAPRGNIYDSKGNVLATNQQIYVLTYMQTDEATKAFYTTMNKVFSILNENGEKFQDEMILKIDSNGKFYYDFKTNSAEAKKAIEVRFKSDRGMNDIIKNKLFKDKKDDYTDEELEQINTELLKYSIDDTFYYLINQYDLFEMLLPEGYTKDQRSQLAKQYKDETGEKAVEKGKLVADELLKTYSLQQIRNFMVVKDAIKMQSYKGYRAVTISNNLKKDTAFIVSQQLNNLPGIDVTLEPVRSYPFRELASHVIGYMSSIDGTEEKKYELSGYDVSSDLIGVSGIESSFEDQLKGNKGGRTVKVNSQGRLTEELFKLESYPGNNVHLTIDKNVQYAAEQALKDTIDRVRTQEGQPSATRGAVVAIEVATGRILALASYPSFDPNDFAVPGALTEDKFNQYFNPDIESFGKNFVSRTGAKGGFENLFPKDENGNRTDLFDVYPRAMYNYATQGLIPPGSIFKPATSVAGLMSGAITTSEYMQDNTGVWKKGTMEQENFQRHANGPTDLRKALEVSSNYFFYETGYRMWEKNGKNQDALDTLAKYVWHFGLGVDPNSSQAKNPTTGIEIEENFGQVFNFQSWKNKTASAPVFELVNTLNSGVDGNYRFIPLNIGKNDNDSDDLKAAKESIKKNITNILMNVGTAKESSGIEENTKVFLPDVKKVMQLSDEYKSNVSTYEASKGKKADAEEQAEVVAEAIALYVQGQSDSIYSYAQIVFGSIGQGMDNFTPVQLANYVATLANGGTRHKLMLVDKITSPTGEVVQQFNPTVVDKLDIPANYLQAIKEGMHRVVTSPANGLAYQYLGHYPFNVAGKTGTADFGTEEQYSYQGRRPYGNFISFAPLENPKIAIMSSLYDGNKGSSGATIHEAIYNAYFQDELKKIAPGFVASSASFKKYVTDAPKDNIPGKVEETTEQKTNTTNNGTTNTNTNNR